MFGLLEKWGSTLSSLLLFQLSVPVCWTNKHCGQKQEESWSRSVRACQSARGWCQLSNLFCQHTNTEAAEWHTEVHSRAFVCPELRPFPGLLFLHYFQSLHWQGRFESSLIDSTSFILCNERNTRSLFLAHLTNVGASSSPAWRGLCISIRTCSLKEQCTIY